jgi:hypothetical protein
MSSRAKERKRQRKRKGQWTMMFRYGFWVESLYLLINTYVIIRSISATMPPPRGRGAGARRELRRRAKR